MQFPQLKFQILGTRNSQLQKPLKNCIGLLFHPHEKKLQTSPSFLIFLMNIYIMYIFSFFSELLPWCQAKVGCSTQKKYISFKTHEAAYQLRYWAQKKNSWDLVWETLFSIKVSHFCLSDHNSWTFFGLLCRWFQWTVYLNSIWASTILQQELRRRIPLFCVLSQSKQIIFNHVALFSLG